MGKQTDNKKKALAKDLYLYGAYTLEEIADKVDSSRQTISRWAKADGWEDLKVGMTIGREQILKNLYRQIQEINENISSRDKGQRFANSKEADSILKLSTAIKKMEDDAGISELITSAISFTEWLRKVDLDKAKEFIEYWDAFIKERL